MDYFREWWIDSTTQGWHWEKVSTVFQGEYHHGLDAKGRLILPSRIREELGAQFVLTKGMDGCLFIFTLESWESFLEKLRQLPTSSREARKLKRHFIGSSQNIEADKQGRFLIHPVLREFAEIEKEVTVIGLDDRIEVWSREKYEAYQSEDDMPIEEIAGNMEF